MANRVAGFFVKDLRALREEAAEHWARGRHAQAEVLYRQLILNVPRDAQLWVRHAEALRKVSRPEESVESYRRAATLLSEQGHWPRAIAALKLALEMKPDNVDVVSELIRLEVRKAKEGAGFVGVAPSLRSMPAVSSAPQPETPQLALPMLDDSVSEQGIQIDVVAPPDEHWPQVRRLSAFEVAIKSGPEARWVVLSAQTEIHVRYEDQLSVDIEF